MGSRRSGACKFSSVIKKAGICRWGPFNRTCPATSRAPTIGGRVDHERGCLQTAHMHLH
jgi:hypothetical protein